MANENDSMGTKEREEVILEFLADRGAMFKPKALFDNLEEYESITFGYKTVRRRLEALEDKGYVETVGDKSYYRITERGRAYLDGEPDANNFE